MKILKNKKVIFIITIGLLFFILIFKIETILTKFAIFFTVDNPSHNAEVVLVLSGNPITRIPRAIELVNNGFANKILITSPKPLNSVFNFESMNNLDIIKKISESEKFSKEILTIPSLKGGATSTFDEAYDFYEYNIKSGQFNKIILVTDFYHTRRSLLAFNKVFKKSGVQFEAAAAYNDVFNESNWWKTDLGIATYIIEPIKLFVYFFSSSNAKFINNH